MATEQQSNESTDQILNEIDDQRDELGSNIQQLSDTVKEKFNLRRYIEDRPMDLAIIALGAGLFLASRKSPNYRVPENREMTETFAATKDALMAVGKQQVQSLTGAAKQGMKS